MKRCTLESRALKTKGWGDLASLNGKASFLFNHQKWQENGFDSFLLKEGKETSGPNGVFILNNGRPGTAPCLERYVDGSSIQQSGIPESQEKMDA